ncbi:MAG: hypothetical protein ACK56I_29875, partial [bacterium]
MLGTGQTLKDHCETFKAHPRPVRESNQIARMIPVDQPNKIQHPRGSLIILLYYYACFQPRMLGTGQTLKDHCETFKAHPRPVRESNQIARMIPVDQPNKIQHPR